MPVPRRSVVVCAARWASEATWSTKWVSGRTGEGGRCGLAATRCSPVQIDSQPAASAVVAAATMVAGSDSTPALTPKNPNLTSGAPSDDGPECLHQASKQVGGRFGSRRQAQLEAAVGHPGGHQVGYARHGRRDVDRSVGVGGHVN